MKLKVCGMKYIDNIKSIADLSPDYLGFIFYAHSKRNFIGKIPELPEHIKKTGVFVNEELAVVISLQKQHQLHAPLRVWRSTTPKDHQTLIQYPTHLPSHWS